MKSGEIKVPKKFKPYPFHVSTMYCFWFAIWYFNATETQHSWRIQHQYHTELTVTVESLTNLGFGIARVPLPENVDTIPDTNGDATTPKEKRWVIFIPNVIPGESVRIRIYRNHATYSDADLLEILTPSEDRIEPRCDLATVCGGCQYQHVTIERQRKMKTHQVQDLFERIGGLKRDEFPAVFETLGTDEVFEYRSKM
jgi:tRNA/tmRNA/rRNA uracil-C5-methylase (TrmA/RlmC/RlmD family)